MERINVDTIQPFKWYVNKYEELFFVESPQSDPKNFKYAQRISHKKIRNRGIANNIEWSEQSKPVTSEDTELIYLIESLGLDTFLEEKINYVIY